ncbi:cytochrome P450 2G1-like isoform X4 [Aquarana catesbeiana]|uniref:cytochrome P450 2G1-like isoform X4 n=1 Tax=Aquarana catesbeiana TaxID=8400 RepID=UPI003CC9A23C
MELTGLLTAVLILLSCCYFIYSTWKTMYRKRGLPPGPTPLPLIGNLLNIKMGSMANSFVKLSEQYGSVYTLYFGLNPIIVICGYEAVKEALIDQNDDFGARGKLPTISQFTKGYGLSLANGERWKKMRTFTFKTLKDFGLGKKSNEWKIQEEAQCVVEEFRKSQGHPLNPSAMFMDAFSNILCSILFGDRYDYTDRRFKKLLFITEEIFRLTSSTWGQVQTILPTLMSYIPGPHHKAVSFSEEMVEFVAEIVKSCQQTLDLSKPKHFVDCFLIKIEKEKDDPNTEFTMKNLLYTIHNLFVAATETLSISLQHTLLSLLVYPEIEDKLHEEIDRVIGRDRMVNMEDKFNMPYTQAVIHEVQRFCDIVPFNVPHMVTKDTMFRGYHIPKGTDVYTLLCIVHRDSTQFSTPYKFNPNHFLDENGQFKKNEAFMAFSVGKRSCPGEGVARMELFIFLTTILQNFKLTSQIKFSEADVAPKLKGFLNVPIKYELSFIPR